MNTEGKSFDVVNGPSKDRLIDAFKYAYSKQTQISVKFSVVLSYTAPKDDPSCVRLIMLIDDFHIVSLQHENGSGHSFIVEGYCQASLHSGTTQLEPYDYNMYYNAKTRKGTIEFRAKA